MDVAVKKENGLEDNIEGKDVDFFDVPSFQLRFYPLRFFGSDGDNQFFVERKEIEIVAMGTFSQFSRAYQKAPSPENDRLFRLVTDSPTMRQLSEHYRDQSQTYEQFDIESERLNAGWEDS